MSRFLTSHRVGDRKNTDSVPGPTHGGFCPGESRFLKLERVMRFELTTLCLGIKVSVDLAYRHPDPLRDTILYGFGALKEQLSSSCFEVIVLQMRYNNIAKLAPRMGQYTELSGPSSSCQLLKLNIISSILANVHTSILFTSQRNGVELQTMANILLRQPQRVILTFQEPESPRY